MIKACIFDLDGTLANTLKSLSGAGNDALQSVGYEPLPEENYKYYAGDGAHVLVERILRDSGDTSGKYQDQAYAVYLENLKNYRVEPYDGMMQTLMQLRERGIRTAVVSNKPHIRAVECIADLFGSELFDYVQGLDESVVRKPDPTGALRAARMLGAAPAECMYLGDTNVDMLTGNRAGMYTVGVLWGFRTARELLENGAQELIAHPSEILKLLEAK